MNLSLDDRGSLITIEYCHIMLAIQKPSKSDACAAHVLPCRIHHNGPSKITKRHWQVATEKGEVLKTWPAPS